MTCLCNDINLLLKTLKTLLGVHARGLGLRAEETKRSASLRRPFDHLLYICNLSVWRQSLASKAEVS